ncbi:MAG TPA: MFS transporter [Polyangiaceae bacterium]|nr:MFS transporter [Polyangiaceae bacterium]
MQQDRPPADDALARARRKAYWRLIPILFLSYVVAYIDRVNIAFAKLTMSKDLPAFDTQVIAMGAGLFFLGYFLLEIPGTLIVERWSARKWIARIMISWGILASLTAWVQTPGQFYVSRFLLGLAEAGFFPGVIVFLTRWFIRRDRARAFALFLMATPVAQVISPLLCNPLLRFGTPGHAPLWGLHGWQLVFIVWGLPAVVLGLVVLTYLTDRPAEAKWLADDERAALEAEIEREKAEHSRAAHLSLLQALKQPRVLLLAFAYFCVVTANYGTEFFLPTFLESWYKLKISNITYLVVLPPLFALGAQILVGHNSDRTGERRLHTAVPIALGALALLLTPLSLGVLPLTMSLLIVARTGIKAYQPAFWTLPSTFLTSTAAAGAVGFINSFGNLGGFVGPNIVGYVEKATGSFTGGICFLGGMMLLSTLIILYLFKSSPPAAQPDSPQAQRPAEAPKTPGSVRPVATLQPSTQP